MSLIKKVNPSLFVDGDKPDFIAFQYSAGAGMLEVVVAALILSIGLIGLATMQVAGISVGRGALFYTQATIAVDDMANRMYLNPAGVQAGYYDGVTVSSDGSGIPPMPGCSGGCNTQELANMDIREWGGYFYDIHGLGSEYAPMMPDGASGYIEKNGPGNYIVSVLWDETDMTRINTSVTRKVEMQVVFDL